MTRKIVASACRIAAGKQDKLYLDNISVQRDWGWAPQYVEAMWMMLQHEEPDHYVIATGETHSLEEFMQAAFSMVGLEWRHHVVIDPALARPHRPFGGPG